VSISSASRPRLAWVGPQDDFPASCHAWTQEHGADGLLAAGASLTPALLVRAYQRGIFPWSSANEPILWWSPDPRMVLRVANFQSHRSIRQAARQFSRQGLQLQFDAGFSEIIKACAQPRPGQDGTWNTDQVQQAYLELHHQNMAHCLGLYRGSQLLAGLYFVNLGRMVFGESMFTNISNGSKGCLAALVDQCASFGVELMDCQQQTSHLASLGAQPMARSAFEHHLSTTVSLSQPNWPNSPLNWADLTHNHV